MDEAGSLSQTKCGWKMPRHFHSENAWEGAVRSVKATSSRGISEAGTPTRERDRGGHLMPDHVQMMISIPPECSVSRVVGYIKGKSASHTARIYGER
jgi:putative transposase